MDLILIHFSLLSFMSHLYGVVSVGQEEQTVLREIKTNKGFYRIFWLVKTGGIGEVQVL